MYLACPACLKVFSMGIMCLRFYDMDGEYSCKHNGIRCRMIKCRSLEEAMTYTQNVYKDPFHRGNT